MLGSASSVSGPNIVLNTAVAEELRQFADVLENAKDFNSELHTLIQKTIREHKRIIFNGNGYDDEWIEEAARRGLLNLKTTPDCMPYWLHQKNIALFTSHKVFTEVEMRSRYDIVLDNYCKILSIEALTMLSMARQDILPAVSGYAKTLSDTALAKKQCSAQVDCSYEVKTLEKLSSLEGSMFDKISQLEDALLEAKAYDDLLTSALAFKDKVFTAMQELREVADELELITAESVWPVPSYGDIIFSVR